MADASGVQVHSIANCGRLATVGQNDSCIVCIYTVTSGLVINVIELKWSYFVLLMTTIG